MADRGSPPAPPARASGSLASLRDRFRPFPSPLRVLGGVALYNLVLPLRRRPLLPRAMCLYVTYRCNFRCQMCGIWKLHACPEEEWDLAAIERMMGQRFFSRLEFVNLNGGEPTLRADLPEIAALLLERVPRLRNLTLNTNGVPEKSYAATCTRILELCRQRGVRFGVSVSLHRIGPAFDSIAGVPDAYGKVKATLDALAPLRAGGGFFLSTNCVLTPESLAGAEDMVAWSRDEGIPVNFTVAEVRERFNNEDGCGEIEFTDPEERRRLVAFLRRLAADRALVQHHALRYGELAEMVESGRQRSLACHYALAGVIVGSDGSVYYCKKSRPIGSTRDRSAADVYYDPANLAYRASGLLRESCPTCLPNTFNSIEMLKDVGKLAGMLRRR